MANAHFVRKMKEALDDLEVRVDRKTRNPQHPDGSGRIISALYEPDVPRATVYTKQCKNFDEAVTALLHEAFHHLPGDPDHGWPEWVVSDGMEKIAFSSPALRWKAAKILGDLMIVGKRL